MNLPIYKKWVVMDLSISFSLCAVMDLSIYKKVGGAGPFHQFLWVVMDSNHRRQEPADLQSAPFGHSGNYPLLESECKINTFS